MEKIFELLTSWKIPNDIIEEFEGKTLSFELLYFFITLLLHI